MLARTFLVSLCLCLIAVLSMSTSLKADVSQAYQQDRWWVALVSVDYREHGEGNGFIINSRAGHTELLTVSHTLHPGEVIAPNDQDCASVEDIKPGDPDARVTVSASLLGLNDAPATVLRDDYCRDLAVISISVGPYPIACLYKSSAYFPEKSVGRDTLTIGYLPLADSRKPNRYPGTQGGVPKYGGRFYMTASIDHGLSGAPVVETSNGLVIGMAAESNIAYDNLKIENFLLGKTRATWVNPANQSMDPCKPMNHP